MEEGIWMSMRLLTLDTVSKVHTSCTCTVLEKKVDDVFNKTVYSMEWKRWFQSHFMLVSLLI